MKTHGWALLFAAANALAPAPNPLRVLRTHPGNDADPRSSITVTFDRPVVGDVESAIPAARIFAIEPNVAGRAEWRDPITLRFVPAAPLEAGAEYRVTVSNDFVALDGSRLEQPLHFTVRARAPSVLGGDPVGSGITARHLDARPTFRILLSDPTDAARFASLSSIMLARECGGARIGMNLLGMRGVSNQDAHHLQYVNLRSYQDLGDTLRDRRRIIELRPDTLLPRGCGGRLDVPLRRNYPADSTSWMFATYGPLTASATVCAQPNSCSEAVHLVFSTPVRGTEMLRRLRITPQLHYTLSDSAHEFVSWSLPGRLEPNRSYTIEIDAALTDVFGQRLGSTFRETLTTRSYAPAISYPAGMMLMERYGPRVLPVQAVNVDTLIVRSIAVPESAEARFLSTPLDDRFHAFDSLAVADRRLLENTRDVPFTGRVALAATDARTTRHGTLHALQLLRSRAPRVEQARIGYRRRQASTALIQVTNLAVHARVGIDEGMVWVTGVNDARPRAGVQVELHDRLGKVRATARTDAQGFARLTNFRPSADSTFCQEYCWGFEGYVSAQLNEDRALVGINSHYDTHLAPWLFQINSAGSAGERTPIAAALFTERGIYRPGEPVYAKAIVRRGLLGALRPAHGDSLRWEFLDPKGGVLQTAVTRLSTFGTAQQSFALSPMLQVGHYQVRVSSREHQRWRTIATTSYQVAEYRAPEFLVEMNVDTAPRFAGDSTVATIAARYLFGARMAGAPVRWTIQLRGAHPLGLGVRGTEGWMVGDYLGYESGSTGNRTVDTIVDTLDANGEAVMRRALAAPGNGRAARVTITATVTDANRQTVSAARQAIVHPAAFYIGARQRGKQSFWQAGEPVTLDVIAVRPTGARVADASVEAHVIRREWRQGHRMVNGALEPFGTEVSDTVATCRVRTAPDPVPCTFTPARGGSYIVAFNARDAGGRTARTSLWGWAMGPEFSSWNPQSPFRIELQPDRPQYSVGDTAALLVVSPFDNAEAWLTIERERILESRRLRLPAGTSTIRVPITEALTPNAFVSVLLTRGRVTAPTLPDSLARPTLRVGYAELRVAAPAKKLDVQVSPQRNEYQPADSARVRVAVKDVNGRGRRAEVTLWAVDEGVLALTDFPLPDPHAQIYRPRGLGVRLSSNLVSLVPRAGDSTSLAPKALSEWEEQALALSELRVRAGFVASSSASESIDAAQIAAILRSRFQTTAFFLGSVLTDEAGQAVASAKLPDNLTTFRIMAVAVTDGDLYGSGKSSLLVSRPLLARPSLPRFLRAGDRFSAGVVVNQRTEGTQRVDVQASSAGSVLLGEQLKSDTLRDGAGREVRFDFLVQPVDTARFQFAVRGRSDMDAVALNIPVRPSYHPLAQTIAGALRDTASVEFTLEQDVDPTRSRLELSYGSSTLSIVRGVRNSLHLYPYYCTEQTSSAILPVIALYRVQREFGVAAGINGAAEEEIRMAIRTITRRQRNDGAIALWPNLPWSTPTLTANATRMLLEARDAGFAVDSTTLDLVRDYLLRELRAAERPRFRLAGLYADTTLAPSERIAAVDVLSRLGHAEVQSENALFDRAGQLRWEDRVLLAEVLARRGATQQARSLLAAAWREVRPEGRTLTMPTGSARHYFLSTARPAARLLTATLEVEPEHAQIGPLVETLVQQGRALSNYIWNTQDYGAIVLALLPYERRRRQSPGASVHIRGVSGTLFSHQLAAGETRDTSVALTGLLSGRTLRLTLTSSTPRVPVYYYLTVREVPNARPVNPVDRGIQVERWYERIDTRRPVTTVAAGELVRVRLRITVPDERHFVVVDDPLPAGIEVVDPSLRTVNPFGRWTPMPEAHDAEPRLDDVGWYFGGWDENGWSAFDYKELRDDRVIYFATMLWKGSYTATYLARATTAGTFVTPPAHAEEMYNPAVNGRTGGGLFTIR